MMSLLPATPLGLIRSARRDGMPVTYEADGKTFEGYYVAPPTVAPLVFLVHDWSGLDDYEMTRADMLAELGYAVFAADLFGKGVRPNSADESRRLTGEFYQDRRLLRSRLAASLDVARGQGADATRTVAVGYCFGGAAVLELARSGADLRGYVTFHGVLRTPEGQDYSQAKGEFLVLHGGADQSVSMEDFARLSAELEAAGLPYEMITYGEAPHAFTVFGTSRYRPDADRKSWERFTLFLEEVLGQ